MLVVKRLACCTPLYAAHAVWGAQLAACRCMLQQSPQIWQGTFQLSKCQTLGNSGIFAQLDIECLSYITCKVIANTERTEQSNPAGQKSFLSS